MAQNGQFWSFCRFFYLFPPNEAQIDSEWPISPNSQLFPSFATKASHFWRNLKNFCSWGEGTSGNSLSFSTFSNRFTPKPLKMTHNGKFCQESGLDWLKMAIFGPFACFPIFSPKMRLRLTWNGQFHPIHNFSHLLPPKHLIFGEISKIFIPGGGGYIGKFFQFFNFFKSFPTKAAQNHSQWPILLHLQVFQCFPTKVAKNHSEQPILPDVRLVQSFHIEVAQNDSEWPLSHDSQLFPYFATEVTRISLKWAILVKFQPELKYLSGIATDLHRTFRTGLFFLSQSK